MCLDLYVNFSKSSLVVVNVDEIFTARISGVLRCRCDTLPINYLGLPLGSSPNRIFTWKPVLFKICRRLSSWKGRLLSMVRRAVLIKSVLIVIPLYYMSMFCIPKTVAQKITKLD
jgi:mannosylglycoprotein endo-beta-mannosidase